MHKKHTSTYPVCISEHEFTIFPNVFCPEYGEGSRLLAEALRYANITSSDIILEIGTGSGAISILASEYNPSKIVATDISPYAIQCATLNADRYRAEIEIRQGDLFDIIKQDEQ